MLGLHWCWKALTLVRGALAIFLELAWVRGRPERFGVLAWPLAIVGFIAFMLLLKVHQHSNDAARNGRLTAGCLRHGRPCTNSSSGLREGKLLFWEPCWKEISCSLLCRGNEPRLQIVRINVGVNRISFIF